MADAALTARSWSQRPAIKLFCLIYFIYLFVNADCPTARAAQSSYGSRKKSYTGEKSVGKL